MTQEGDTGIVELKAAQESTPDVGDDDPRAVKLMVDYLYLHGYDPKTAIAPVSVSISEDCKDEGSTHPAAEVEQTVECHQSQSGVPVSGDETKVDDFSIDETAQPNVTDDFWGFGSVTKKRRKGRKNTKRLDMWQSEPEPEPEPEPEAAPELEPVSEDYHLSIDSTVTASTVLDGRSSFLEIHAKVFAIASKYDVRSLEYDARKKFKDQTQRSWEIADLIAAIHVVFNLTPDSEFELRNILKDTMVGHALTLVQHPAGWAVNKRTPNRRSARSFSLSSGFCSFVQGLLLCSSFVRCTVLKGAWHREPLHRSQQSFDIPTA